MKSTMSLQFSDFPALSKFTGCEHKYNTDDSRIKGCFCSDTVFNLSNKVLTVYEIKVLEKGF